MPGTEPINCRSEVGKAVGLIDAMIAVVGALCERARPWEEPAVQEALCDLRDDAAFQRLLEEMVNANRSPFR